MVWISGLLLAAACEGKGGDDDGAGSGSETGTHCECSNGAYVPVCGVDGMTYDATCGLECVEAEILCMGFECPCPEIACGDMLMCDATEPVCTISSGGAEPVTNYACGPLPATCDGVVPPTCECAGQGGCDCVEDPAGYFTVTCNLP